MTSTALPVIQHKKLEKMPVNQHISEYINYYCESNNPGFAILLTGEWGSGKTWFINHELDNHPERERFLYISLYGVSSFKEIENQFFEQLHPFLSSKPAVLAGKVFSGLLKASLKIDLNNDQKDDGTASIQIPQINLQEFLSDAKDKILVFDDIERCSIEIDKLLGYINYFVEHGNQKVILIANEDELILQNKELKADDQDFSEKSKKSNYYLIKEKLIGKSFKIKTGVNEAYDNFTQRIENSGLKALLESHKDSILSIYYCSLFNNLRALKFAIFDFERVFDLLDSDFQTNSDLILNLFRLHLLFSLEIKCNGLNANKINEFLTAPLEYDIDNRKSKTYGYQVLQKQSSSEKAPPPATKYQKHINLFELVLTEDTWTDLYVKGFVEPSVINQELNSYLNKLTRSDWQLLYNHWDLTEAKFRELLTSVEQKFEKYEYTELGEVLHILGLFLAFSSEGVIALSSSELIQRGIEYINFLNQQGALKGFNHNEHLNSFYRHGVTQSNSDEMKEVLKHIYSLFEQDESHKLTVLASGFIDQFRADPAFVYCFLNTSNKHFEEWPNLYNVEFLHLINLADFVDALTILPTHHQRTFGHSILQRYDVGPAKHCWEKEYDWLTQLDGKLREVLPTLQGCLSHRGIQSLIDEDIEPSLEKIRQLQSRKKVQP